MFVDVLPVRRYRAALAPVGDSLINPTLARGLEGKPGPGYGADSAWDSCLEPGTGQPVSWYALHCVPRECGGRRNAEEGGGDPEG